MKGREKKRTQFQRKIEELKEKSKKKIKKREKGKLKETAENGKEEGGRRGKKLSGCWFYLNIYSFSAQAAAPSCFPAHTVQGRKSILLGRNP